MSRSYAAVSSAAHGSLDDLTSHSGHHHLLIWPKDQRQAVLRQRLQPGEGCVGKVDRPQEDWQHEVLHLLSDRPLSCEASASSLLFARSPVHPRLVPTTLLLHLIGRRSTTVQHPHHPSFPAAPAGAPHGLAELCCDSSNSPPRRAAATLQGMSATKPETTESINVDLPDRWEIVNGEPRPKEATSPRHGRAQAKLTEKIGPFHRRSGGPPDRPGGWWFSTEATISFGPGQERIPDVAGWRRERMAELPDGPKTDIIPDWICEILSPSNANDDTIVKMRLYYQAQVKHYWLLDPRTESLQVYRWHADGYLFVLGAERGDTVRAEPFDAIEIKVGVFFGEDEE